ncbi:MAG: type II secretion system protein [Candidatus Acidiferrales bacterium]
MTLYSKHGNPIQRQADSAGKLRRFTVAGFTLIELMVVVTIMLILMGLAAVRYDMSIKSAHEAALHHDLSVMRDAIEQYTLDKQQAPQSLDDLVSAGYLREIPKDPVTGAKDWVTETSDVLLSPDEASGGGISDVHSPSDQVSPFENTPYSSW